MGVFQQLLEAYGGSPASRFDKQRAANIQRLAMGLPGSERWGGTFGGPAGVKGILQALAMYEQAQSGKTKSPFG